VIGEVDRWIAREFSPHRLSETIRALAEARTAADPSRDSSHEEAARKIAECDRKLAQYRAALEAGASPATVAGWIAETEAEKQTYALVMRRSAVRPRMTEAEIKSVVDKLVDVARVLSTANAEDKSEIFRQLGLKLTYHPGRRIVEAKIEPAPHGFFESVRGPKPTNCVC
jgi:site-specific DNA recombinase